MGDYLLKLSASRAAKKIIRTLRLPVPLPPILDRAKSAWEAQPLAGKTAFVGLGEDSVLAAIISEAMANAGGHAWLRGKTVEPPWNVRPHALIYDGTGLSSPNQLHAVYEFFHAYVRQVAPCGRAVVMTRPPEETEDALCRAARRSIEGFVRSLGKEIGRKGLTAQTIHVDTGAESRLEPVLRFLLSKRAAYISGQVVHVSARVAGPLNRKYVMPLQGKVALVTGAARGIGEATVRALAREGARVIVMDRPPEMPVTTQVAQSIQGTALACDVTDDNAANIIAGHVREHYDGLDIIIHNAGITRDKTLGSMSEDKWDMVLQVNLLGLIRTNEALLSNVRDGGRIVVLSSIGGIAGNPGQTNYAASKAGLIGYVQGLAPKVAGRGITVNAVAPGFIETKMTAAMPLGTREVARRLCSLLQGGLPTDIAETITFLASPDASGLTGEVLRICGGNFIGA